MQTHCYLLCCIRFMSVWIKHSFDLRILFSFFFATRWFNCLDPKTINFEKRIKTMRKRETSLDSFTILYSTKSIYRMHSTHIQMCSTKRLVPLIIIFSFEEIPPKCKKNLFFSESHQKSLFQLHLIIFRFVYFPKRTKKATKQCFRTTSSFF